MNCSPPGSSVHGISQAKILERVAIPSPDLPDPGIKPLSPALAGRLFTTESHQESPKGMDGGGGLVAKSCLTIGDPTDYSPPGSSVHGISQARILEWVAVFFSRGSS